MDRYWNGKLDIQSLCRAETVKNLKGRGRASALPGALKEFEMRKVRILISVIFLVFCFWTVSDSAPTRYKFISADMTVPINTTYVEGTDFISKQIMLAYTKNDASITFYVKGNNAGCSKDVIFKFATFDSLRNKWDTADVLNEGLGVSITAKRHNGSSEDDRNRS